MSQHKQDLISCYDAQASHFHNTRGFHKRPELHHIDILLQDMDKDIKLLDLGCGSGRVSKWLDLNGHDTIQYTGVDISPGMITEAKKNYPDKNFLVSDMGSYLKKSKQQSIDVVLCLAAFHHLETQVERLQVLDNIYRILNYGGIVILINRSYSDWFFAKYRKECLFGLGRSLISLGKKKRNDVLVPWKDPKYKDNATIHHRYYHIFTHNELRQLIALTDFQLAELVYIDQSGKKTMRHKDSRNSFLVLRK